MRREWLAVILLGVVAPWVLAQRSAQSATPTPTPNPQAATPVTLQALNQRLPEVVIVEQPLEQVIEWLAEMSGLNVVVRWQALEDAGVPRDKLISMKVRNLRLSQVLWLLMNQAGGTDTRLAYRASGALLVLSTADDLGKEMITKVYDIADLLITIPRASRAAAFDVTQGLDQAGQGGGGGGGGGGGQGMFQQGGGQNQRGEDQGQDQASQDEKIQQLIDLIQSTIEPDSWRANSGSQGGSVTAFQGRLLIVHNTILVHQLLGGYVTTGDSIVGP